MVHPLSILHVRPQPGSLLVVRTHHRIHWHPSQPGVTAVCTYRSQVKRSVALAVVRAHSMMRAVSSVFVERKHIGCATCMRHCNDVGRCASTLRPACLLLLALAWFTRCLSCMYARHLDLYLWSASITVSTGTHRNRARLQAVRTVARLGGVWHLPWFERTL